MIEGTQLVLLKNISQKKISTKTENKAACEKN